MPTRDRQAGVEAAGAQERQAQEPHRAAHGEHAPDHGEEEAQLAEADSLATLPLLRRTPGARVVVVSSGVHHQGRINFDDLDFAQRGYSAWRAYAQSKLANLLFALELQRKLAAAGESLIVTAAHPGYTATDLQRTAGFARLLNPLLAMRPPQGALPTLRAATDPDARAGEYFGPRRFFEMNGPPERARINRRARDLEVAARLWQVSEQLTGVHFDLDTRAAAA